ncbi:MAG: ribosome maturation factor RimP [Rhodospirillaceae bacterium]|nr:ribosome maturation factor RimP [Rhodospirillaceae bacterium]
MERLHRLEERVEPTLEAMGFAVVRIAITGSVGRKTLQVMAERKDGSAVNVDDCAEISRTLSAIFDVEDPVPGRYDLEVSSTGIDRPLTRLKDFSTYAGFEAKVDAKMPVGGRKRFRGRLKGLEGENITIVTEEGDAVIAFDNVNAAKLILTDELIAATTAAPGQQTEH